MAASTNSGAATPRSPAAMSPPTAKEIPENSKQLELIEELTTNVDAVQERVLAEILARNADSEYLAVRCGLAGGGATDRTTFKAKVPLVTYEDLKPYVMRVANGDTSPVLTGSGYPVSEFFISSGTSGGEPKLIPVVEDDFDRRSLMASLTMAVMSRHGVSRLDKGLYFYFVRRETMTPGGLPARSGLTSIFKRRFSKELVSVPGSSNYIYTSPPAAILCEDVFQSMYAQMLCGLCHRHAVLRIGAPFAYGVVHAISFLQLNWQQLAADIEAGTLNQCIITDQSVREAVAGILKAPDPELAQFIRAECSKDDWAGIITRIWPNTKYLDTIVTGSMAQYVSTLNYYSADSPVASTRYVSSECGFGINLRPMCDPSDVSYTIMPNMAYFEFLPVDDDDDADATTARELVELAGVEAGREYEVVVTTYTGLNRYRVGDVLRVTGFHNAAPQFRFVGRKNVLLSLHDDKTGEAELQHAVERAASTALHPHGAAVLDYTSRVCTKSIPGHYVIYWELRWFAAAHGGPQTTTTNQSKSMDGNVLARCCLEMEEALNYIYRKFRAVDGSIGPLEIRVVRSGAFQELADYAVAHGGTSMAQYKVPRCVTVPAIIRLLDSRVVSSHFSPTLPHWEPVFSTLNRTGRNVEATRD